MKFLSFILFLLAAAAGAQTFDYSAIGAHPRLFLKSGGEEAVKASIREHAYLKNAHDAVMRFCDANLDKPVLARKMTGRRLLAVSNEALKRVLYYSYAYRMTGDMKYAKRAEREISAVCAFEDWNPAHFLDVAEMAAAVAIGYDWLHDALSDETKKAAENAIIKKAFDTSLNEKYAWFYRADNNWNQVCNAGLTLAALAVFEACPERAEDIIEKAVKSNPLALSVYAPDGAYPEGYGYWGYGTNFQVMLLDALDGVFKSDAGLSRKTGFFATPKFVRFMGAPSLQCFNFGDCSARTSANPAMFWFAKKNSDASAVWLEKKILEGEARFFAGERLLPLLVVWASGLGEISAPDDNFYSAKGAVPLFIYRGGWNGPADAYFAVKGGSASVNHAHMDAGSFVYEIGGVRWAIDLGMQNYESLESKGIDLWNRGQDSQRWRVFRIGASSHNTITVNDRPHKAKGFAPIVETFELSGKIGARLDLSEIFAGDLKSAERTVVFDGKDTLTVSDTLANGGEKSKISWRLNTNASAEILDGGRIKLSMKGREMIMAVNASVQFELKIWPNDPPEDYDAPNGDSRRVGFEAFLAPNESAEFSVSLTLLEQRAD